jgi:probable addiction module antidote protein/putative addiction module killer protein
LVRVDRLVLGNPGDVKPVESGISELRIDYGPGYRVYYLQDGQRLIMLLCGGDNTGRDRDIKQALRSPRNGRTMSKTSETFSPYDGADYLTGVEDVAAYLEAALAEGGDDPAFIAQALGAIARSGNVSELARRVGISREGLYKALSADGNPSFATIMKVAGALGLKLHFESVA